VLRANFKGIPCERDVRELRSLPDSIELLTAGFPCQDLSQAGLTAGIGGKRSGLVEEVFRLLDRRRVPWVVLENVSFMLHLDGGKALHTLVTAFEERGYRWAYRVVNTLAFLPQRRERVLFVATNTAINPADVLLVEDAAPPAIETTLQTHAHGFYWTEGVRGLGWAPDGVPTLKGGSTIGIPSPPAILMPDGTVVTPDIRDAERLQGFDADWTSAAERGAKRSSRWSLVGNAVSTPIAGWLGKNLTWPGSFDEQRDRAITGLGRWPRAARFDGENRHAVEIGPFPVWEERSSLVEFLLFPGKPLSVRATRGFLARTQRSSLRFVAGFQDRIRRHLEAMEARDTDTGFLVSAIAAE
jgi:DNA (cytosine-5)-methyltransferase 1